MLEKAYSPESVEAKWRAAWEQARLFHSEPAAGGRKAYTIVIPPPNVTGALHIGHALNNTLQDVLIRWQRLHGSEACWVPGTDHGGIATQNVMEKQLKAERLSRQELGRERFLERMQAWTRDCKATILGQLSRLGCALDFGREAFTMDEPRARAVFHAFKACYDDGLISRGERIVNWCVRCGTALSDIEVEYEERKSSLWHLRYPHAEDPARFVTVATTRPETMLGDTAVAVHPDDERYRGLVGQRLRLPLTPYTLDVVADSRVDPKFGTGAVKLTPFHDPNDFEIWQRNKHAIRATPRRVIGFDGRMTAEAGDAYRGLSREKAREKVVGDLQACGALFKTEPYKHSVGVCYRCAQVIEPLASSQWFMEMGPLAREAAAAAADGRFTLYPESWRAPYLKWLQEIRPWCLSRQIWWGHRIPVWYDADKLAAKLSASVETQGGDTISGPLWSVLERAGLSVEQFERVGRWSFAGGEEDRAHMEVSLERPARAGRWLQDQDVLDTWFSSALWPLSVFGWPERTAELGFYYPTSVLVTGYEILYLWVARMQMMGLWFEDKVPFSDALIHGIVRDKSGKKMSKSLGNVIDPLVMMDKHGTDAFRFALAAQAYPGKDIPFAEESLTGPRNFANKLWNATRFVLMRLPERPPPAGWRVRDLDPRSLSLADRWILSEYAACRQALAERMREYNTAAAANGIYSFLWDRFCDWYVELAKLRLEGPEEDARVVRAILVEVLAGTLKLLHPFMPYITEELFAALSPHAGESAGFILASGAPGPEPGWRDAQAEGRMGMLMDAVHALRALRSQLNVPPGLKLRAEYAGEERERREALAAHADYVERLAGLERLAPAANGRPPQSATAVSGKLTFYVPLAGVIDFDKERARLAKDIERLAAERERCRVQLANPSFVDRAPAAEVEKIRARQVELSAKHASLLETLASLQ